MKEIYAEQIKVLNSLVGVTCINAFYCLRGLELTFSNNKMINLGDYWRVDKSNKTRVGISDMAKIFDDPDMIIYDEETEALNKKLSILNNSKLKSFDLSNESLQLRLTNSLFVISHRLGKKLNFWELYEKREDAPNIWVPVS